MAHLLHHNSSIAVSCIGLSKLSFKACFLWLQAVGEVTGCRFNTRGCHDKWYTGWSTPALTHHRFKDQIDHLFLNKVGLELCDYLKTSNIARPRAMSDSSNSTEGNKAIMPLMDKAKRLMKLEAESSFTFID